MDMRAWARWCGLTGRVAGAAPAVAGGVAGAHGRARVGVGCVSGWRGHVGCVAVRKSLPPSLPVPPQVLPTDVDYRVMLTFLEFYNTLLQFVNFKLYHTIGVSSRDSRSSNTGSKGSTCTSSASVGGGSMALAQTCGSGTGSRRRGARGRAGRGCTGHAGCGHAEPMWMTMKAVTELHMPPVPGGSSS